MDIIICAPPFARIDSLLEILKDFDVAYMPEESMADVRNSYKLGLESLKETVAILTDGAKAMRVESVGWDTKWRDLEILREAYPRAKFLLFFEQVSHTAIGIMMRDENICGGVFKGCIGTTERKVNNQIYAMKQFQKLHPDSCVAIDWRENTETPTFKKKIGIPGS